MENFIFVFLLVFSIGIILVNVYATLILMRTHFVVKNRRRNQIIFVWLVPIIGALIVIYIDSENYIGEGYKQQVGNNTSISRWEAVKHGWAANINSRR